MNVYSSFILLQFAVLIAFAAVSSAHYIPSSYQKVILYKLVPISHEAPKWEAPKWQEPKWEEPKWEEPKWEAPKWQEAPKWEEPKWEEPKWEEPKWEEPKAEKKNDWEPKEAEKPATYDFKYEVHDEKTGDIKRQSETAKNGAVKGQYSLIDSDGYRRVVEYTADDVHGFQATVKREPTSYKVPIPAPKPEEYKPETHWW
jgi:Insect cuticle protein